MADTLVSMARRVVAALPSILPSPEKLSFISRIPGLSDDRRALILAATPLAGLILWLIARSARRPFRNLPPGPKGLPLIGDVSHVLDHDWLGSPQRKDDYGEIMYLSALGKGILVVNSKRVAVDLLEKRSNIYSDRPRFISAGGFLTQNLSFLLTGYGDLWRRFRRPTVDVLSKTAVQPFHPIQNREAIFLALALMKNPPSLKQFQRHTWSSLLSIVYNHPQVESDDDPVVAGVAGHILRIMHEIHPGNRLVEFFPWMKYIPSWFAKWKRDAQYWFIQDSLRNEHLLSPIADDIANEIDRPCFGTTVLKNQDKYPLHEHERAWLLSEIVAAGGLTTSVTLYWWLLAMLAFPEVQVRAQAELDEVVGRTRPPTFADLPSLPYIRAMVKELPRWSPPLPFGIPHASSADDWYRGMFIPKGTIILSNMRVINYDPAVFGSDSAQFNPARYLDEKGQVKVLKDGHEDGHVSFGHGRRLCPGRFVAEATLAIDFATLLWALRFERPEGAQGELDVHTLVRIGIGGLPKPFECKAVPRFTEAEALLKRDLSLYK
ncbi:cytochrome P450 [Lactarius quietus]|nr:cytochrome P450 [Lactarius quietus]